MKPSHLRTSLLLLTLAVIVNETHGHGMLLNPINRGSLWRVDPSAVPDWDDDGANCGGLTVQIENGERCGICGDNYRDAQPRAHELGGEFGQGGKIVASYHKGQVMDVFVELTANHKGWFQFSVCDLSSKFRQVNPLMHKSMQLNEIDAIDEHLNVKYNELIATETEDCFRNVTLADGNELYQLTNFGPGNFTTQVQLPTDLTCEHCVFRWHYRAGNNWGICPDGTGRDGCGPQETFVNCADISIV